MIATQLNGRVKSGEIRKGSVIQLIEYICSSVQNRKLSSPRLKEREGLGDGEGKRNVCLVYVLEWNTSEIVVILNMETIIPDCEIIGNPLMTSGADSAPVNGDLRRYNNAKGDGKVFSFDLLDSDSGEIRVTCFNAVCDRFYDVIEVGKVYMISKGTLKPAQKNFNHLKNEWEIFLESTSTVDLAQMKMFQYPDNTARMFDSGHFPVVAVKAAKVNDFSGKSVGTISSTQLFINLDIPENSQLNQCVVHRGGKDCAAQSISRDVMPLGGKNEIRKTISQIKDEGLGRVEECDYRYLLQAQIQDHSGLTWVTAFQESGEEILGCSAKELYALKSEEQEDDNLLR
ncbi:Replication protein A 70 kDa DNA-binding subunit C [Bienertia sinuspersici]